MRKVKDFFNYFSVTLLQKGASVFLIPIYTHYMSPDEYGILSICLTIASICPILLTCNIAEAVYFAFLKKEKDAHLKLTSSVWFVLVLSFIVLLLGIFFPVFKNMSFFGLPVFPFIYFTVFFSILSVLSLIYFNVLQATENSRDFSFLNLFQFITNTCLTLFFLIFLHYKALGYIYASLITQFVLTIIILFNIKSKYGYKFRFSILKDCLSFSTPLVPHTLAHWSKSSVDRIFLANYVSSASAGIYYIASSFSGVLLLGIEAFKNVNNPIFFKFIKEPSKNENYFPSILNCSVACFAIVGIAMSIFSREVVALFLSKSYAGIFRIVPFLVCGYVSFMIYINIVNVLFSQGKTYLVSLITLISSAISILFSYFSIKYFNLIGASISFLFSNLCISIFVYVFSQKWINIKWNIVKSIVLSLLTTGVYFIEYQYSISIPSKIGIFLLVCSLILIFTHKEFKFLINLKNTII